MFTTKEEEMATWTLVPCLQSLRDEFNRVSPKRDKASDGSVGDQAHADSSSDHNPDETGVTPFEDGDSRNEVHAIDIDDSGPWPGGQAWFDRQVDRIVAEHRAGRDDRLQNVIRNGRIASRSSGWVWRKYNGSNPHDHHAHFSARYITAQENDTSSWGVYVVEPTPPAPPKEWSDMASKQEMKDLFLEVLRSDAGQAELARAAGVGVHNQKLGKSPQTIAQALQPLQGQVAALMSYAANEAGEVPPTAEAIATETVRRITEQPRVEPEA